MKNDENLTERFIRKAEKIHNNKYDYSLVEYIKAHEKIKIICPIHGIFEQRPNGHLNGNGCKECSKDSASVKKRSGLDEFIENARKIHNNKYDYSLVEYKNNKTLIKIICPVHGVFEQYPTSHLTMKAGCRKCSNEKLRIERVKDVNTFISQAKITHGLKYNYSKVSYINTNTPIIITCPIHGDFTQKPYKHLQGQGCPICGESKLEKKLHDYLELKKIRYIQQFSKKTGCDWIGNQSLDFFLLDYNVAIECQGEQHFKPVDFGNKGQDFADQMFIKTRQLDKSKFDKCEKNGIKLLYFTDKIDYINGEYFNTVYTNENELIHQIITNYD